MKACSFAIVKYKDAVDEIRYDPKDPRLPSEVSVIVTALQSTPFAYGDSGCDVSLNACFLFVTSPICAILLSQPHDILIYRCRYCIGNASVCIHTRNVSMLVRPPLARQAAHVGNPQGVMVIVAVIPTRNMKLVN